MTENNQFICSWSGGKDSYYALVQAKAMGLRPAVLLNVLNEQGEISRSHGIPQHILQQQADAINIPLHTISSSWAAYEQKFTDALLTLKNLYRVAYAVFGDIDLQAHRDWEEKVCQKSGIEAILPLWQKNRKQLVMEMLDAGMKTMIVSCNETMGEQFIGRILTTELITELEQRNIDPCGENGEFHTLVLHGPLMRASLNINVTGKVLDENYWFALLQ